MTAQDCVEHTCSTHKTGLSGTAIQISLFFRLFAPVTLTKTAEICIIISISVAKICVVKELTSRKRKLPVRVPVALVFVLLKIQFRTLKTTNT